MSASGGLAHEASVFYKRLARQLSNFFLPGLDVMPFPTTPSTRGKRAGQELKSGTSKSP